VSHKKTPDDDPSKKDLGIIVEEVTVLESKVSKIVNDPALPGGALKGGGKYRK